MPISNNCKPVYLFVGPTAHGLALDQYAVSGLHIHPPVQRGDIDALLLQQPSAGVIVIVDGTYFAYPAVGHIELRKAIQAGWQVWGLCSMGAIRAYEMRHLGMQGFGLVYQEFFAHDDFQDDEVALLHGNEEPYFALSEPLIHWRHLLHHMVEQGEIGAQTAHDIITQLKSVWFGYRTLPKVCQLLQDSGYAMDTVQLERKLQQHRVKQADLISFLQQKPWGLVRAA